MKKKDSKLVPPKKVKLDEFDIMQTLGTGILIIFNYLGSFGRVRLARETRTRAFVAVKILKKAEIIRLKQVDHIIGECCILGSIRNPFIAFFGT